jgi:Ca2+-transporting ATPase
VILAVVIVNALIGSHQEGRAERSMAALRQLSALQVRVRRDGVDLSCCRRASWCRGDMLLLAAGDAVAADARLVDAAQLHVAEAALTGESVPVAKSTAAVPGVHRAGRPPLHGVFRHPCHGRPGQRAVVVATGIHTEVGRIAGLTERARSNRRRRWSSASTASAASWWWLRW